MYISEGVNSAHFSACSSSLFGSFPLQCSEWVSFYTLARQFSGSRASGGCGKVSQRAPTFPKTHGGGSRASASSVRSRSNNRGW